MPTTRRRWTGEGAGLRGRQARPGVREGKGKEQEVSSPCLVSSRQEWTLPSHFIEIFIFKCWLSVVTIKAANTPMWELVLGGYTCPRSPFLVSLRSSQFPRRPRSPLSPSLQASGLLAPMSVPFFPSSVFFYCHPRFLTCIHSAVCWTQCQAPGLSPTLHFTCIFLLQNDTDD